MQINLRSFALLVLTFALAVVAHPRSLVYTDRPSPLPWDPLQGVKVTWQPIPKVSRHSWISGSLVPFRVCFEEYVCLIEESLLMS